jgi:hypothetical protein
MGLARAADPVKQFVAVLWSDRASLDSALEALRGRWGEIDFVGAHHGFDLTDYYAAEMGGNLKRTIVSFRALVPPESLVEAKLACNEIEAHHTEGSSRRVNLDIGYLDDNKIVLGSVKAAGQKIHLGSGVYADLVGRYREGRYQPFEWTFPDFRCGRYDAELASIRARYLEQVREFRRRAPASHPPGDNT